MPEVQIINITKRYGNIIANNQINFTIQNGEYVSVIGPSGCGKTTLIKNIAGIIQPDEGDIHPMKETFVSMVNESMICPLRNAVLATCFKILPYFRI
jgi:ABC-type sugar transport system ATPase subunit